MARPTCVANQAPYTSTPSLFTPVPSPLGELSSSPANGPEPPFQFDCSKSYRETRAAYEAEFERAYVAWLLARHEGNISAAAREARMDRKYLYDLAREHGLRRNRHQ